MSKIEIPKVGETVTVLDADFSKPFYVGITILSPFKKQLQGPWIAWGKFNHVDVLTAVVLYEETTEEIIHHIQIGAGAECNFTDEETLEAEKIFGMERDH